MGFKAVVLSWDVIFDQEKNKFSPYAIKYLKRCSSHKTKIVIFSTKNTDPCLDIEEKLKGQGITVDNIVWSKVENSKQVRNDVITRAVASGALESLPAKELFYAESKEQFNSAIMTTDLLKKTKRHFSLLTSQQVEELSERIPKFLNDYFDFTEESFRSSASLTHALFTQLPLPAENAKVMRGQLLQLQRNFEDGLYDCIDNILPRIRAACQKDLKVFFDKVNQSHSKGEALASFVDALASTPLIDLMVTDVEKIPVLLLEFLGIDPISIENQSFDNILKILEAMATNNNLERFFKKSLFFSMQWASEEVQANILEMLVKVYQPFVAFYAQNKALLSNALFVYRDDPLMAEKLKIFSVNVRNKLELHASELNEKLKAILLEAYDFNKVAESVTNRHGEAFVWDEYIEAEVEALVEGIRLPLTAENKIRELIEKQEAKGYEVKSSLAASSAFGYSQEGAKNALPSVAASATAPAAPTQKY